MTNQLNRGMIRSISYHPAMENGMITTRIKLYNHDDNFCMLGELTSFDENDFVDLKYFKVGTAYWITSINKSIDKKPKDDDCRCMIF